MRVIRNRYVHALVALIATAGLSAALSPVRAAGVRQSATVVLQGAIKNTGGAPVRGATISADGNRAKSKANGSYHLALPASGLTIMSVWAPGYTQRILSLDLTGYSGTVAFNVDGGNALADAFRDPATGCTLNGLAVTVPASTHQITFHVNCRYSLFNKFAVTFPSGHAAEHKLKGANGSFTGTLKLKEIGAYQIEVLTSALLPLFNVYVFRGTKAVMAPFPTVPPDPTKSPSALAAYGLQLINQARAKAGVPPLAANALLTKAAQGHTDDMVTHGYFYSHPHIGSDGSNAAQRVARTGFHAKDVGEDVGTGDSMGQNMVQWLLSPFHRHNLLANFRWAGLGVKESGGTMYVTIDFAR